MKLWLSELQDNNEETKANRSDTAGFLENWKDVERVFQYQKLSYVSEIIRSKMISCHHNDALAKYFCIDKT